MKKVYCIGIWGIWVSWLARYYKSIGYEVYGSDTQNSSLIESLKNEWMSIVIGENSEGIDTSFETVIYSEAISHTQKERQTATKLWIKTLSYPQALGEITQDLELVSIAGTHGKSTTTTLASLILKESSLDFTTIVGTLVPDFWMKNFYHRSSNQNSHYFILESCEYRESFLNYNPKIGVITNIEADHLDYYKNEKNYFEAFQKFLSCIRPAGFAVLNMEDEWIKKLEKSRTDISYIEMYHDYFLWCGESYNYRDIQLQVPWDHVLTDAKLAYAVWFLCNAKPEEILKWLANYTGSWRRMETIWITENENVLMSDYGHHPTEIRVTTKALKERYPEKKLFCIFQPHQHSRTIELLEDFKTCFTYCDSIIIPNIYASRDNVEDIAKMTGELFVQEIQHQNKLYGNGLENTLKIIQEYDIKNPNSSIILLLWAGNIDDLRKKILLKN